MSKDDLSGFNAPPGSDVLMKTCTDGFDEYKIPKYIPAAVPALMNEDDIFTNIRVRHLNASSHMTFDPVVQFVQQAKDPSVIGNQTDAVPCESGNSPIIAALAQAAENGKQVSVLVTKGTV